MLCLCVASQTCLKAFWYDMLKLFFPSPSCRCTAAGGTSQSLGQSQFLPRQAGHWMAYLTYFGTGFNQLVLVVHTKVFLHVWPPAHLTSFLPSSKNMGDSPKKGFDSSIKENSRYRFWIPNMRWMTITHSPCFDHGTFDIDTMKYYYFVVADGILLK